MQHPATPPNSKVFEQLTDLPSAVTASHAGPDARSAGREALQPSSQSVKPFFVHVASHVPGA